MSSTGGRSRSSDAGSKIRRVISTHVLDTERGEPARGVLVRLFRGEELLAEATTDDDGRIRDLADPAPGAYRLVFHPDSPFFRRIEVEVAIEADRHHHVPLLLSPYACTVYRGS
jgi:5-hydroxyisourate hydrolase